MVSAGPVPNTKSSAHTYRACPIFPSTSSNRKVVNPPVSITPKNWCTCARSAKADRRTPIKDHHQVRTQRPRKMPAHPVQGALPRLANSGQTVLEEAGVRRSVDVTIQPFPVRVAVVGVVCPPQPCPCRPASGGDFVGGRGIGVVRLPLDTLAEDRRCGARAPHCAPRHIALEALLKSAVAEFDELDPGMGPPSSS